MVLGAVLIGHALYYLWPDGAARRWAFYVLGGVAFALLCLSHLVRQSSEVGALGTVAAWWGALEGGQQAVCGAAAWGSEADGDLCLQLAGPAVYALTAAGLVAFLISRRRHG